MLCSTRCSNKNFNVLQLSTSQHMHVISCLAKVVGGKELLCIVGNIAIIAGVATDVLQRQLLVE